MVETTRIVLLFHNGKCSSTILIENFTIISKCKIEYYTKIDGIYDSIKLRNYSKTELCWID